MTPRLVHVEWVDPRSVDAWTTIAELQAEPVPCETVGYVVRETDDALTIAGTVFADMESACCMIVIPRSCVRKVSDLTVGEEINLSLSE
jgi:hypothetical protein